MRINTNIAAQQVENSLYLSRRVESRSLERLSTGLRINRASDDAAGLAISENLRSQVRGSVQARKNAMDGISLLNIADGGANEITSMIQRMRELAVQSANGTLTSTERSYLQVEYSQLGTEIDRIAENTKFNNQSILSGTGGFGVENHDYIHIGGSANPTDGMNVSIGRLQTSDIGIADQMLNGTVTFKGNFWNKGPVNITISFDGTSNSRGTLVSAIDGTGAYIPAAAGSDVTGINFFDAAGTPISVKKMLTDLDKVGYISADYNGDKTPQGILPNSFASVGWTHWPSSGVTYSPSGSSALDGTIMRPTTNITTQRGSADAILVLDSALEITSRVRADIGAYTNRLTHTIDNLMVSEINLQAAESQIRDVDFAEEVSVLSRHQIIAQSATAMLAQAKTSPQGILNLLR